MVDEIIDWRLAEYLDRGGVSAADTPLAEVAEGGQAVFVHDEESRAELWREYMREEIPGLYGLRFNTGSWNQGFVVQGQHAFLLVTLDKSNLQVGGQYLDHFTDPEHFSWHSQTRTARASKARADHQRDGAGVCDPPVRAGEQDPRGEGGAVRLLRRRRVSRAGRGMRRFRWCFG